MPLTGFGTIAFDPEDLLAARIHRTGHAEWRIACVIDVGMSQNEGVSRVDIAGAGAVTLWKFLDPDYNPDSGCERFGEWVIRLNRTKFIQFPTPQRARVYFVTSRAGSVASVDLEGEAAERLAAHFPEPMPDTLEEE